MLTLQTFNILKSDIIIIIIPVLPEVLHATFLDTVLTRMVYKAHHLLVLLSFLLTYRISNTNTCGLKGLCILSASGSPPA
jgi:hypothetical protein